MAWVETRITRTTQPQDAVGVDWENQNTKGLLGSWVGAGRGKAVFGTDAKPQGNAVAKAGRDGVGLSNTDTGSNNFWKVDRGTTYTYTQQVTFEALIEVDSFTSNVPYISGVIAQYVQPGSSVDDRGPFLRFGNGSSENRDKPFFAVMQNNTERGVLGPSLQTGRKYHLLGTYDGANVKLFIDGVLIGANATTGSFENGINAYTAIGTDYPGTSLSEFRALQGRIYLANVYGVGKTDAQAKSIAANPWQTFEPEVSRIWVDDYFSAGGGATVIPIGVQATAAVGTPSATGAARATPAGVSASSAVGTPVAVGGASIPATVLPAGVQATGAVGTVSATGAAVAQPVGVVASSAVGTPVAIAGTSIPATVLPAGVQASGAVGTPAAQGAAIAQPLGVAATAYVGTPTIATGVSGVAVAYPAGVQAIGQVGTLIATGAAWTAAVGVQAVASVGTPTAYAGEIVIYAAGAQTRPSRLQSSSRPSRLQTGTRASR